MPRTASLALRVLVLVATACSRSPKTSTTTTTGREGAALEVKPTCLLVEEGFGPEGHVPVKVEVVTDGLEVPWSIAFLPGSSDFLVTERPGRIRIVRDGRLAPEPVATVETTQGDESGLLGIVLHPRFRENRTFFAYYTVPGGDTRTNRISRWVLDETSPVPHAREERILLDGIPATYKHDGGRLRFGPDGMLYASTGDAARPELSPDVSTPAGKLLRLTDEGAIPRDNPIADSPVFLLGIRNLQAFDWLDDERIILADHGPSGELGREGHDEVSVAKGGDDLGWPGTWGCEAKEGVVTPLLAWDKAVPPGGGLFYRGDAIPEWKESFLIGTLRSQHLHRIVLADDGRRVAQHEVYLQDAFGRLRDVVAAPDGAVYVTTSNCEPDLACPEEKDRVLRITSDAPRRR